MLQSILIFLGGEEEVGGVFGGKALCTCFKDSDLNVDFALSNQIELPPPFLTTEVL